MLEYATDATVSLLILPTYLYTIRNTSGVNTWVNKIFDQNYCNDVNDADNAKC